MTWSTRSIDSDGFAAADTTLPLGVRVWLLREGYSGRVVARAHGGLLYRVRRESSPGTDRECPACDLLPLHETASR